MLKDAWSALAEIKVNSKSTPNQGVTASVKIPQQNMSIEASSEHPNVGNEGLASFAIDGNKDTIWHTKYGSGFTQLPHDITINLGKEYTINKYSYLPRSGSSNGNITKYEIQVSTDGQSFKTVASGNWDNNSNEKVVQFDNVQATHVRLVALEGIAGFATAAELNVYSIPDNIAINESTTVSANVNNEAINNVKDNNLETAWEASAAEDKVVTFDLGSTKDISAIEILKSSNEALKYKVEYSKDGETWISIADRSKNDKDYNNYVEEIDGGIIAKYIKLTFLNNDVKIDEVKLYKGDSTQPLVNYISVVQGIYNSAVVGDMAGNYPQEAKDTLGAAIEKAKAELDKDPDSVRVQELVQELKTAVSNFRNQAVKINRIKLAVLIDEVDAVLNSLNTERLAELTEEQRNVVESAIEELKVQKASAITVYETVKVGQSQIDGAYDSLKVAFDNYLEVADEQAKYEAALAIAKETVGNAVVGSGNGQYTQEAVEALNAAIDKAEADFANVTDITEIATIVEELNSEVETFKSSVIIVNITELEAAIVDAEEALSNAEGINTPNAIAEFTTAVETAKSVLTNTNASQVEVDEAVEALKTAKAKFDEALVVDKADLNKLIENAGEAINKLNKYSGTEKLVAKMEAAVLEAKVIANDANVTKDVVDAASGKLVDLIAEANEKLAELENGIFKTHLIITVEEANKVTEAELSKVVPVVVTEFKAALAEAQGLLANSNATQEQIDASFTRLSKAMQMLSFEKGDKQYLIALVERIDTLDGNNYIKSTWDKLQGVVAIANGVIADENALEAEVTETYTNLIRSFLELRLKPNKDALNDLINKMESLDSSKYTSETWAVLEAELANAKNILANEEATSEDVDNAEKALRTAFDGLLANATDDNNGSGNNGNNGNSGNGNGNKPSEKPQKPGKPGNDSSLPKTGGASSALAVVFGGILAAGGALLGRKNKKK